MLEQVQKMLRLNLRDNSIEVTYSMDRLWHKFEVFSQGKRITSCDFGRNKDTRGFTPPEIVRTLAENALTNDAYKKSRK